MEPMELRGSSRIWDRDGGLLMLDALAVRLIVHRCVGGQEGFGVQSIIPEAG